MEINNMMQENIASIQQSINMSMMKKSMHQDAQSISALLEDMKAANAKTMESSVTPYKGGNIDVRV